MTAGPFAVDEVIKRAFPKVRDKLNNRFPAPLRRKIEVWIIILGVFIAGFLAFNKEHQARLKAENGEKEALQQIAENTPSELAKQVKTLKNDLETANKRINDLTDGRVLTEEQQIKLISRLKPYAHTHPKIEVFYSNDEKSQKYARQWEAVLKKAGWNVIEEDKKFPTHMYLSQFSGIQIEVKDNGQDSITGAPARLGIAIQEIGEKVLMIPKTETTEENFMRLNIGTKEWK